MSCASDLLQYKILCIFDKVELWQCNYVCIEITDEEEIQYWNSVMYADKWAREMVLFSVAIDNSLYNDSSAKY